MKTNEIQNLIKDIIEKTTVGVSEITIEDVSGESVWFSVQVAEPHYFTSREGEGLYALNHLVRRIIEEERADAGNELRMLIDINGFQKRKVENLKAVAHMMAERARYFKSNIEVDPMPAFERRIVHEFLSSATDLKTESSGFGRNRRVVIKYVGDAS